MEARIEHSILKTTIKPRSALRQTIMDFAEDMLCSVIDPDVITQQVYNHECRGFAQPENLEYLSRTAIRALCTETICKPERGSPLSLNGHKHLCAYYSIKRGKGYLFVPIEQATNDELIAKAGQYRNQSDAMGEHADELDNYREARV